ncbi:CheR family methyltransferase [Sutcliffiella horikoshii]|uniref:CheR family methyltransferase n=1 Tax=Sutcliffiella horikoshii TaxID=79883 RepID=UPI0038509620
MLSQNLQGLKQPSSSAEEFLRNNELADLIQKQVFATILKSKLDMAESEMKIWIAGCSTGQEVYSLAILLKETIESMDENVEMDFKIYATDLDYDSVKIAGAGVYPDTAFENVPSGILNKYFDKKQDFYVVKKSIREHIIFAPHNIAKDPGFHHLDFISCRNVLHYFQPTQQQRIISSFHHSLNEDGYLFLGQSGSIGESKELFRAINKKWKIYIKQEVEDRKRSKDAGLHAIQEDSQEEKELQLLNEELVQAKERISSLQVKLEDIYIKYEDKYETLKIDSYHPILFVKGLLQIIKKQEFYKEEYAVAMLKEMNKLEWAIENFLTDEQ